SPRRSGDGPHPDRRRGAVAARAGPRRARRAAAHRRGRGHAARARGLRRDRAGVRGGGRRRHRHHLPVGRRVGRGRAGHRRRRAGHRPRLPGGRAAHRGAVRHGSMTEPNPLVAQPVDEDAQPWDDLAGAGGLDTLGAITDPLDSLLTAGVGWLIEHVWFLHEPLDALAGDPAQITAQARTWHNVGRELGAVARDHRAAAAALGAWEGAAGDGYRAAVDGFTGALERAGRDAGTLADLVLTTGAQVGTVRAAVRDAIAGFVAD